LYQVIKILSGGAERGYGCLNFSAAGDKLASVSLAPDFMLTVWDWEVEQMGLHSKAFGQDIYKAQFSVDDPRRLTTSGTGHIRFWKMAATFTGLKLQGSIGKFGKIDLSDIDNFVELPDGKVLSGTETGSLLLWEGNFIKCRFTQVGGGLCHAGHITYLELDRAEQCVISASVDGFVRWWDFTAIDAAEVDSDHSMDFELLPLAEYFVGKDTGVRAMIDSGIVDGDSRFFLILDTNGKLQTVTFTLSPKGKANPQNSRGFRLCDTVLSLKDAQASQLSNESEGNEYLVDEDENFYVDKKVFDGFHAGAVSGLDTCPVDHLAVTCGADGSVRCIDYINRKEVAHRQFNTAATCVKWLPTSLDAGGRLVVVGFADGVVRVLGLGENDKGKLSFIRKMVFKPHNAAVTELSFNAEGSLLASAGKDGIIFFLDTSSSSAAWSPIRFVTVVPGSNTVTGRAPVSCERISWNINSTALLCTCSDGILREMDLQQLQEARELTGTAEVVTFEAFFPLREVSVRVPVLSASKSAVPPPLLKTKTDATILTARTADEDVETATTGGESPSKASQNATKTEETTLVAAKVSQAIYSLNRTEGGVLAASVLNQKACLLECDPTETVRSRELPLGLYSTTGTKDFLKTPAVTALRYGWNKTFLYIGAADGSVTVRSSAYLETFTRAVGHNSATDGTTFVAGSFDDNYVLSAGKDGLLVVHQVQLGLVSARSQSLFKDLEAGVFGDSAVKPPPKAVVEEPAYLTFVSTLSEGEEDTSSLRKSTVLQKPLLSASEEQTDISGEAYSIQDNRLKLEEDSQKASANDLKGRVLASIKVLQRDYEKIVRENESVPETVRLHAEEMTVDREYFDILATEGRAMVEEVHKECAFDMARSEKLVEKVNERLRHGLLIEEFALSAFTGPQGGARQARSVVKSLRAQALDPAVIEVLKEVQAMVRQQELREAQQRTNETAQRKALEAVDEMKNRLTSKEEETAAAATSDHNAKTAAAHHQTASTDGAAHESTADARRDRRKERKDGMTSHLQQKPNEDEDDIRDLNAIRLAEKTIGDFKLKCADDYEVPEEQRINTFKKVRQMGMLEESMLTMRLQFNKRFLALRDLKRQIIFAIRRDNQRVRDIDAELKQSPMSEALWEPAFDPSEYPDDVDEVTAEELRQYQETRSRTTWEQTAPPSQSVTTGNKTQVVRNIQAGTYEAKVTRREFTPENRLQNFLADRDKAHRTPPRVDPPKYYEVGDSVLATYTKDADSDQTRQLEQLENTVPVLMMIRAAMKSRMQLPVLSESQQLANSCLTRKLNFERDMILRRMAEDVEAFREAVDDLRLDRHSIIADLKLAELKLLTLFQEFKLLQTFESRDNTLQQKQVRCKGEETEIITLGNENKLRLEGKNEEIQHWNEKLNSINVDFRAMLPDSHPYVEMLSKIFKKRVKRNKGGGDDEGEEEDYDDGDDEEDDDDDDDEEVEDICPPGCDQQLFERILDLREKKLDTEEVSSEIQKSIEDLRKTIDRLRQREKQIVKDAIQTEVEVQQFQLQKQAALNQIHVVVPLRISQLFMFEQSGKLTGPTDSKAPTSTATLNTGIGSAQTETPEEAQLSADLEILRNPDKRTVVSTIDMKSHVLFTKQ
jgi:WD40 repeat protein